MKKYGRDKTNRDSFPDFQLSKTYCSSLRKYSGAILQTFLQSYLKIDFLIVKYRRGNKGILWVPALKIYILLQCRMKQVHFLSFYISFMRKTAGKDVFKTT